MSDGTTYDARVYRTEIYKAKKITTYHVRWKVGGKLWREGFRTAAQADSFRSALLTAPPERRGLQPRHRQASSLGADEGRHHVV
jgi:hypothetical protein